MFRNGFVTFEPTCQTAALTLNMNLSAENIPHQFEAVQTLLNADINLIQWTFGRRRKKKTKKSKTVHSNEEKICMAENSFSNSH